MNRWQGTDRENWLALCGFTLMTGVCEACLDPAPGTCGDWKFAGFGPDLERICSESLIGNMSGRIRGVSVFGGKPQLFGSFRLYIVTMAHSLRAGYEVELKGV